MATAFGSCDSKKNKTTKRKEKIKASFNQKPIADWRHMRFGDPHVAAITASKWHAEFISTDLAKIKPPMIRRFMLSAEADRFNESLLRHRPKQAFLSAAKARGRRTQNTAQQNAMPSS